MYWVLTHKHQVEHIEYIRPYRVRLSHSYNDLFSYFVLDSLTKLNSHKNRSRLRCNEFPKIGCKLNGTKEEWKDGRGIILYKRRAAGSGKPIFLRSRRIFFWMSVSGGGSSDGSWWRRAFPGECPPPPGFGWDLRMKPPFWPSLRILFRTPSTTLWEYWVHKTSGKRDEHGTARERVNDCENAEIDIRKTPRCPPRASPQTPAGGSV